MDAPARGLSRRSVVGQAVRGLGRGLVATVAMSIPMLVADRRMGTQPPKRITDSLLRRAGARPRREGTRNLLSTVAHIAFGGSLGALFSGSRRALRVRGPALPQGLVYGLAVWGTSYKGWIPAFGILPPPEHDRPGRQRTMFLAHLIFGLVLGGLENVGAPADAGEGPAADAGEPGASPA